MELTESYSEQTVFWKKLSWFDWLYAVAVFGGAFYALAQYGAYMDHYEKGILMLAATGLTGLGWYWKSVRVLLPVVVVLSLFGISQYHADLARAEKAFFLKFLFSSQSAIMWMSALFFMATGTYWLALFNRSAFTAKVGTALTWSAITMGLTGLMVRWYESYLISPDIGHIPISNLYEVFILFSIITATMYMFYEQRYKNRQLGAFVLPVISAAVCFLLWYTFGREAQHIQPLVPALQSYWMKIHVPANFIGYGAFSLAAMVGVAYLFVSKGILASRLPSAEVLDDLMYKAITIGFAFFTIATILGAMWAAEAWGGYWSWDPKETWALIVWLTYGAYLHARVNMFLSGLHSYGQL